MTLTRRINENSPIADLTVGSESETRLGTSPITATPAAVAGGVAAGAALVGAGAAGAAIGDATD